MKRNQEYIKDLDANKKIELDNLLKKEGSKSKFKAKIQMTWLYIIASAIMLIALLCTNYLLYDLNKLYFLPLIICSISSFIFYSIYFWKWFVDYKKIKEYIQSHWFKYYIWVLALTTSAFFISFICLIVVVAQHGNYGLNYLGNSLPYYNAIVVGIIFDILFTLIAASLDTYVIYHIEVDLHKLVTEYEEDQIDYLKQKIKNEAEKVLLESDHLNDEQNKIQEPKEQKALTQEEIDNLLKQNSLFNNDDIKTEEESSNNDNTKQ